MLASLVLSVTAPLASARERDGAQGDRHWPGHPHGDGFVVSEAQFERMFPDRDPFFTYDGLLTATAAYPDFAHTGGPVTRRQEAAAFLANVSHETGALVYKVNQNPASYPVFCDATQPYGCPAGQDAYYGRGAIMLSWNFNYKAAGDALGLDLLNDPWLVEQDPSVAWATALWYWNTQNGPGTMTGHDAMVRHQGFGETIRSLNGTAECDGGNTEQMQHRVALYRQFTHMLHVPAGRNVTC
ncbi:chitinase [Streptomyces odontomachi]|uniref:chitinase n=1 Tax=Streptomyces odontomachi TaxID=2944940 RepID=UPI00210D96E5|nr:chitinase [Streptomyces sp. ODS25]